MSAGLYVELDHEGRVSLANRRRGGLRRGRGPRARGARPPPPRRARWRRRRGGGGSASTRTSGFISASVAALAGNAMSFIVAKVERDEKPPFVGSYLKRSERGMKESFVDALQRLPDYPKPR